jgi:hypothetical protein
MKAWRTELHQTLEWWYRQGTLRFLHVCAMVFLVSRHTLKGPRLAWLCSKRQPNGIFTGCFVSPAASSRPAGLASGASLRGEDPEAPNAPKPPEDVLPP